MDTNEQRWLLIMNECIDQIVQLSDLNRHQVIDSMSAALEYLHTVEMAKIVGMN